MSLHESPGNYVAGHLPDLSKIDFEHLKQVFEQGRKHTEAAKLRGALNQKLRQMVRLNRSRMNYYIDPLEV
jgi:type I restriction enzyme R subunit